MRRATTIAVTISLFGFGACLFDPEDAEGLVCDFDDECGPELDCIDRLCRKPGDVEGPTTFSGGDPSGSTTAPADGGGEGPTPPGDDGESCDYTNDGVCDEPNICPEGTDFNDCVGGTSGGDSCSPPCPFGQTCIGGSCFDDSPTTCGTNVSSANPTCDACAHANCCDEVQACYGDETVTVETLCLQLNNCIVEYCTSFTTFEELQSCVNSSCSGSASQLNTWVDYNNCLFNACASQC